MFPIGETTLSFEEISNYWSREIRPPASPNELLNLLVSAWWRGEIRAETRITRLELLKRMFERMHDRDRPAIVFVVGQDTNKSPTQELPDGSLLVDIRPRVPVPSRDASIWDEGACRDAFDALTQLSLCESYPEYMPGFASFKLRYDEFTGWLAERAYPKPKFWRPSATPRLKKPKSGRPAEYNWDGVKRQLVAYTTEHGPVQSFNELVHKCSDFATELHPKKKTPDDKTIRDAIKTHQLDAAARVVPGK
jgi:hypothetical protein